MFKQNDRIIMIGDSITDSGRLDDPEGVGFGYVRHIRDYFNLLKPELQLEWMNRGISGNRVVDLEERWHEDVIALKPDWVSVSIGINDVWRQIDRGGEPVYIDKFEDTYRRILEWTIKETDASVILMETTVIEEDIHSKGNDLLKPYNRAIRQLASDYDTMFVPMNQALHDYLIKKDHVSLTTDGVHMNSAGNLLMARTWLDSLELLF